ncbi:MAG: ATP-binding protein [Fibromonadales bacterium]|nr:ATP-binding protein [Fibromonadales bacterium]
MKLSKFDIGAEVISIITKGIYPDPKDALREYIQNGVDAQAKTLQVKIRQESIVVKDDGKGMNHDTLRNAIRIGISDKNPAKNVGFMGIGIYSSFHLCEKLTIYSRGTENNPNRLEMNFGKMKAILNMQKEKRLNNKIKSEELIDLQTILEECISLTENGVLASGEYPNQGTTVELTGIEPEFYTALSDFDEVANYLRNVIPLHFDHENFTHAKKIETAITSLCNAKKQKIELINLSLQVNSEMKNLYRPYRDVDFNSDPEIKPQEPLFCSIEKDGNFFGIAWGCLNSERKKIDTKKLRGFIIKKQGFSIGKREGSVKFFPNKNTYFDRYSGEIIIVNSKILPNASRSDIEYSPLRSSFYEALTDAASKFDASGKEYQEYTKGEEELKNHLDVFKTEIMGAYSEYEEDAEKLIGIIVKLKSMYNEINGRIKRKGFRLESEKQARKLCDSIKKFETTIQDRITTVGKKKSAKSSNNSNISKTNIAKGLSNIKLDGHLGKIKKYENLHDLLLDLDIKIEDDLANIIHLIDEMFIQKTAQSRAEYYQLLQQFKERIQDDE